MRLAIFRIYFIVCLNDVTVCLCSYLRVSFSFACISEVALLIDFVFLLFMSVTLAVNGISCVNMFALFLFQYLNKY